MRKREILSLIENMSERREGREGKIEKERDDERERRRGKEPEKKDKEGMNIDMNGIET